jgi:hypothetical protein
MRTINKSSLKLKSNLFSGEFNNYKKLHYTLMQALELSAEDYVNRVYFEGLSPTSLQALKTLKQSNDYKTKIQLKDLKLFKLPTINQISNQNADHNFCYFIIKEKDFVDSKFKKKHDFIRGRYLAYINDKTILRLNPPLKILFSEYKTIILISRYQPKQNQPCYSNGLNNFSVEKETRKLLIDSKILDINKDLDIKTISKEEKYNLDDELISFRGKYLVFDKFTNSPFQLNLNIKNQDTGYVVKLNILRYYFWPFSRFVNKMDIAICPGRLQTRLRKESCSFFNIFPDYSLASTTYAYTPKWKKTIQLPKNVNILKDKHFLKLAWESKQLTDIDSQGLYFQNNNTSVASLN